MGKIANYEIDNTPQPTDKVIGTDVGDDNKTKNSQYDKFKNSLIIYSTL